MATFSHYIHIGCPQRKKGCFRHTEAMNTTEGSTQLQSISDIYFSVIERTLSDFVLSFSWQYPYLSGIAYSTWHFPFIRLQDIIFATGSLFTTTPINRDLRCAPALSLQFRRSGHVPRVTNHVLAMHRPGCLSPPFAWFPAPNDASLLFRAGQVKL